MVIHLPRSVCCAALSSVGAWRTKSAMEWTLNQLIRGDYPTLPALASLHSLIRLSARRHPLSTFSRIYLDGHRLNHGDPFNDMHCGRLMRHTHSPLHFSSPPNTQSSSVFSQYFNHITHGNVVILHQLPRLVKRAQDRATFLSTHLKPPILGSVIW